LQGSKLHFEILVPRTTKLKECQLLSHSPKAACRKLGPLANSGTTTTNFEKRSDLLGKNAFSGHARVPL
jgi:hypothetical protein